MASGSPPRGDAVDPCRFNTRLQSILSGEPGPDARASLVATLHEFVARATSLTATIVAERSLPPELVSIKPVSCGGVAGGTKYVADGILIKFVEDPIPPGSRGTSYLYGGAAGPRLDRAAKAAGNELRACGILNRFVFERRVAVTVPTQVLIDALGHRVIAMTLLPIAAGARLIYGSCDGGRTVHADDPVFNDIVAEAGRALGVAPHVVGGKTLALAGDVEGHVDAEGRYYLLDLGRCSPPEDFTQIRRSSFFGAPPTPSSPSSQLKTDANNNWNAIFYCHLRFEYLNSRQLRNLPALSSDALSRWGRVGARGHNEAAKNATTFLLSTQLVRLNERIAELTERGERRVCAVLSAHYQSAVSQLTTRNVENKIQPAESTPDATFRATVSSVALMNVIEQLVVSPATADEGGGGQSGEHSWQTIRYDSFHDSFRQR